MSGSFVSQDARRKNSPSRWLAHDTTHTRSQTRQAEKCAQFTGYAVDPVPAGAQDALRGRKQLAAQQYLPQNVRAPSAASDTHASKKILAARGAEIVGTQLLSPAPVPSASPQDVRDLARAQTPGPPGGSQHFFVYGDRRDDVYGKSKSLPAWTERRVRLRRSGAKPSGISCHYSCTTTCCREPQGRAVI